MLALWFYTPCALAIVTRAGNEAPRAEGAHGGVDARSAEGAE